MIDNKLKKFILKEANDRCEGTLVSTLDINFTDVGETFLVAEMQVTPKLHQPAGVLHGGFAAGDSGKLHLSVMSRKRWGTIH